MNLKNKLLCVIAISFILSGCSQNGNTTNYVTDKATYQKTMTKVQNDVNEIMSKDYDYVIENMGIPYCTTYYIDIHDIDNSSSIENIKNTATIRCIYPKYSSDNEHSNSALYIELNNNKVNEVQTFEFFEYEIRNEDIKKDSDLVVAIYNDKTLVKLDTIKNKEFDKFIGLELDHLDEIINIESSNLKVYDSNIEKVVVGFVLDPEDKETNHILAISITKNIISDIKILNESQIIEIIKHKMIL